METTLLNWLKGDGRRSVELRRNATGYLITMADEHGATLTTEAPTEDEARKKVWSDALRVGMLRPKVTSEN